MKAPRISMEQIAAFRRQVRERAPALTQGQPASVVDVNVPEEDRSIPIRIYRPQGTGPFPVLVYVHGAGFIGGDLDSHDGIQRHLCVAVGAVIVAIDYRLAPEHPWPAAFDDVYAILCWLQVHSIDVEGDGRGLVVAGESAGAHLALTSVLRARDDASAERPRVRHLVLVYAALDAGNPAFGSMFELYLPRQDVARGPWGSPIWRDDLAGLPPTFCLWGEWEPTRAEQELLVRKLRESGVSVSSHMARDIGHGVYEWKDASAREDVLEAVARAVRCELERKN